MVVDGYLFFGGTPHATSGQRGKIYKCLERGGRRYYLCQLALRIVDMTFISHVIVSFSYHFRCPNSH